MNQIYNVLGTTKQNVHQRLNREMNIHEEQQQLLPLLFQLRSEHPKMSVRKMYGMLNIETMGRDRFEQFCYQHGLKVAVQRSFRTTTNSNGVIRFDNLIQDFELTAVNQVWVSDITYYRIGEQFYYITLIMDLYSRYIVGYHCSKSLRTTCTTLPALKMAIKNTKADRLVDLIIHSDGGGQYYSKDFTSLTKQYQLQNSMCETVYENAHAERINGTIKNEYLIPNQPQSFKALCIQLAKTIKKYNELRPHNALDKKTPHAIHFNDYITQKNFIGSRLPHSNNRQNLSDGFCSNY